MADDWTVLVVYCDGTAPAKHAATPVAAYRRSGHAWAPIHSATFQGKQFITGGSGIDQLVGETQLQPEVFDAGMSTYLQRIAEVEAESGGERRSQYRWRCPQPDCFDLMANDIDAVHRLFDVYSAAGEVSLARIDELQKANAKRQRQRRNSQ